MTTYIPQWLRRDADTCAGTERADSGESGFVGTCRQSVGPECRQTSQNKNNELRDVSALLAPPRGIEKEKKKFRSLEGRNLSSYSSNSHVVTASKTPPTARTYDPPADNADTSHNQLNQIEKAVVRACRHSADSADTPGVSYQPRWLGREDENAIERYEERAAIREFCGDMSRAEAEAAAEQDCATIIPFPTLAPALGPGPNAQDDDWAVCGVCARYHRGRCSIDRAHCVPHLRRRCDDFLPATGLRGPGCE